MPVSADQFRHALGRFASGVTVVTTGKGEDRSGITVSAFCSVSLNPPYVLICIDKQSQVNHLISQTGGYVVNLLGQDQANLSNHFAQRMEDKFTGVSYHTGSLGMPVLENTLGYLECTIANTVDAGDHYIYIGQVEQAEANDDEPLLYYRGGYQVLKSSQ